MYVLVSFTLPDHFRLLKKKGSKRRFTNQKKKAKTYFTHRIRILHIDILEYSIDLPLKLQLAALLEIKAWCVNNGKENPVKTRLADLNTGGLYLLCGLGWALEKALDGGFLVNRGAGGRICRLEQ